MIFPFGKKNENGIPKTGIPQDRGKLDLKYDLANLQGIGKREHQEDSFATVNAFDEAAIKKQGLLVIVADGLGGMENGKAASEKTIAVMADKFKNAEEGKETIRETLCESIFSAGDKILDEFDGESGSTVVAGVFKDNKLWFASVGDSFIYLFRDRQLVRLNRSQNCLNEDYLKTILSGSVNPEAANNGEEKEALTQFIGMEGLEQIDSLRQPLPLKAGDIFCFCSDGVAGVLGEEKMAELLGHGKPHEICSKIEKAIKQENRKYQDNYTALIVQCVN